MKIQDALQTDHRAVVALLKRAEDAAPEERQALIGEVLHELSAHATAEEEIFYVPLEAADDARDLVAEAKEEHLAVARVMSDLLSPTLSDELRQAKAKVLLEQLEHHIEEEEDEMFGKAEKLIDSAAAEALAGEFLARKEELMELPVEERIANALKTLEQPTQQQKSDGEARADVR